MFTKEKTDGSSRSYNFVAPDFTGTGNEVIEVLFPATEMQDPAYAATLAVAVTQMETFLQPGDLTGNVTINLTPSDELTAGAKIYAKLTASGANRTVTLGTGFDAAADDITVTDGDTVFATFVYDGVAFVPIS